MKTNQMDIKELKNRIVEMKNTSISHLSSCKNRTISKRTPIGGDWFKIKTNVWSPNTKPYEKTHDQGTQNTRN